MRLSINTIRILPAVFALSTIVNLNSFSQSTNLSFASPKKSYIGLSLNPSQISITYPADSLPGLSTGKKNSVGLSIDAGYMFSKYIGASVGVGFFTCGSQLSLNSYKKWYNATDSEGDPYNCLVTGSNIREQQKMIFLSIPLTLNLNIPFGDEFGFYANPGVSMLMPLSKTYSSSGTFSYAGYYPAYDVFLTDVAYEGFLPDQNNNVNGKLKLKSVIPSFTASAGFRYSINDDLKISFGLIYSKMLSGIYENSSHQNFILSARSNEMQSLMEGSSKVTASSLGLKISILYFLK